LVKSIVGDVGPPPAMPTACAQAQLTPLPDTKPQAALRR